MKEKPEDSLQSYNNENSVVLATQNAGIEIKGTEKKGKNELT